MELYCFLCSWESCLDWYELFHDLVADLGDEVLEVDFDDEEDLVDDEEYLEVAERVIRD